MEKKLLVSIILPVYNGESTLQATLDSLLAQTFSNFEILIGIDGTNDKSNCIARHYEDSRIKIFEHSKNKGLAKNLNFLISKANKGSSYIAMSEQDDIYVPERLQWQVNIFERNLNIGLVSGIAEFKSENSSVLFPGLLVQGSQFSQGIELFRFLYINQLKVVNTCMMFRKDLHLKNDLKFSNTYENYNVDWNYILRFSLISEIYGLPKKLVVMDRFQSRESITKDKWRQFSASRQLLKDFKIEFPELITNEDYFKALKMHRKIELGYNSKIGIAIYSIVYFTYYRDIYFLKYLILKVKDYLNKIRN